MSLIRILAREDKLWDFYKRTKPRRSYCLWKIKRIQVVVWNAGCSGCMIKVLLQWVICSGLYTLKAGWLDYYMLIVVVGGRMEKTVVGYTFWGGYRKMNYMSVVHEDPLSLDDSAPYDQFGRHCNRNLQWIKSPFQ